MVQLDHPWPFGSINGGMMGNLSFPNLLVGEEWFPTSNWSMISMEKKQPKPVFLMINHRKLWPLLTWGHKRHLHGVTRIAWKPPTGHSWFLCVILLISILQWHFRWQSSMSRTLVVRPGVLWGPKKHQLAINHEIDITKNPMIPNQLERCSPSNIFSIHGTKWWSQQNKVTAPPSKGATFQCH